MGRAIGKVGHQRLGRHELLGLPQIVIGDTPFIKLGFHDKGSFDGEHDRKTLMTSPNHISARHEDLPALIDGMIMFNQVASQHFDPIVSAAILAIGFAYRHPIADGNGRLHRYLIPHILEGRGFNTPGTVFPRPDAIYERVDEYRTILHNYSGGLMPLIACDPTEAFKVQVLNIQAISSASSTRFHAHNFCAHASKRQSKKTCHIKCLPSKLRCIPVEKVGPPLV